MQAFLCVDDNQNNRVLDLLDEGYDLVIHMVNPPDSGLIARRLAPYRQIALQEAARFSS